MLKAVDPPYTVNMERAFQARNAKAYEIELLAAPYRMATLEPRDKTRPAPLTEQEWLLRGQSVSHVVMRRDGAPARIVVPDPRWFAMQKLLMSRQAKRNPLKRGKDEKQGLALLNAVAVAMPRFVLDGQFEAELPDALLEIYQEWARYRPEPPSTRW